MKINVTVMLQNPVSLPDTAICRVEIRDVSLLDAPSITIESFQAPVKKLSNNVVVTVQFELSRNYLVRRDLNVWAHLSITGSKQVKVGDFITMQAYPLRNIGPLVNIELELQPVL